MSRRDEGEQAEYLQIELDTYLDRRTAYMFGVTASGVRLDHFHPTDNEDDTDSEFEPVWEAHTVSHERRLDGRAADPVFAAALQRPPGARLGPQHQAMAARPQRRGLLGRHRPHAAGVGVAVRRPARHRRCAPAHTPRSAAVRVELVAHAQRTGIRTIRSTTA